MSDISISELRECIKRSFDHVYHVERVYVFNWESDYFGISKSGDAYEVELKMSVSDFKADFKKEEKHKRLKLGENAFLENKEAYETRFVVKKHVLIPNKFYYACPEGIIDIKDVPDYAGLLYVDTLGQMKKIKEAPFLHKRELKLRDLCFDLHEQEVREKVISFLERQYNQKKLAKKAGVSPLTLNRFLKGKYDPGDSFLKKLNDTIK